MKAFGRDKKKNKKKISSPWKLLCCALLITLSVGGLFLHADSSKESSESDQWQGKPQIYLDGKALQPELPVFVANGRSMVPVRPLSELLGAELKWIPEQRVLFLKKADKVLLLPIEGTRYMENGVEREVDAPAVIRDGTAYVPIKFISEMLDVQVDWMQEAGRQDRIFLYSKGQDDYEREALKVRVQKEEELLNRAYETEEINAINLLNVMPSSRGKIDAVSSRNSDSVGIRYQVDDLIDSSIHFLYAGTGSSEEALDNLIKKRTDGLTKESLILHYDKHKEHFLRSDKIVFSDAGKVMADQDYLRIYLSAVSLSNRQEYLICFHYGESKKDPNAIVLHGIDIRSQKFEGFEKDSYIRAVTGRETLPKIREAYKKLPDPEDIEDTAERISRLRQLAGDSSEGDLRETSGASQKERQAGNDADKSPVKQTYRIAEEPDPKLWRLDESSKQVTRTAFYIQRMVDGKYEEEIRSHHTEPDNWLVDGDKDRYNRLSDELLFHIFDKSRMSEAEISSSFNEGFRINAYAEIRVIDPNDGQSRWCRLTEHYDKATPFRLLFLDKNKSNLSGVYRKISAHFPSSAGTGSKSFKFNGNHDQHKRIRVRFLDAGTNEEIANREWIELYSKEPVYVYSAPRLLDGVYRLIDEERQNIEFDPEQQRETKELDLLYEPVDIDVSNADLVLDEWRLSKKFENLIRDEAYEEASLKLQLPTDAEDKSLNLGGLLSPMNPSRFYLRADRNTELVKLSYQNEFMEQVSLKENEVRKKSDAPILVQRADRNSFRMPSYHESVETLRFYLDTDRDYSYLPLQKVDLKENADKSLSYSLGFPENLPVTYEKKSAIYNLALMFLNHESTPRQAPKFSGFEYANPSAGHFGASLAADEVLSVVPKVMLLIDDETGRTDARFVNGRLARNIHPLSHHRASFHLPSELGIKSNVSNQKKASSLAKAMGSEGTPVVDKGAKFEMSYSAKEVLKVRSYALEAPGQAYNIEKYHNAYLQSLGLRGNKIHAKLSSHLSLDSAGKSTRSVILSRNANEKTLRHRLEIRSGKVVSVDGIAFSNLPWEMRNALEQMKLTGAPNNSVLGAFARQEGRPVNEQVFSDLSRKYRHIPHQIGTGWYNEDTEALFLVERESSFDLEESKLILKAPLNVKGLETPINDRMKYSRGIKANLNLQLSLDSKANHYSTQLIKSALILPNAEH